jgi:hypothetical protein
MSGVSAVGLSKVTLLESFKSSGGVWIATTQNDEMSTSAGQPLLWDFASWHASHRIENLVHHSDRKYKDSILPSLLHFS